MRAECLLLAGMSCKVGLTTRRWVREDLLCRPCSTCCVIAACIDTAAVSLQHLPSTQQLLTAHFLRLPSSPTFPLQIPHLAALAYHKCTGRKPAMPNQRLSYAENFLYMLDGGANPNYKPNPKLARALVGGGRLWAVSVGWTAKALHCDKTLPLFGPQGTAQVMAPHVSPPAN